MMLGMEVESSECSSGCQSGWTVYFDQSNSFSNKHNKKSHSCFNPTMNQQEEEEDLSMVSDASSGPSPFANEEEYYSVHDNVNNFNNIGNVGSMNCVKKKKKKKRVEKEKYENKRVSESDFCLDDTASSPFFDYANQGYNGGMNKANENVMDFSCSYSTNHFNEEPIYQNHFSYFQSPALIEPIPQRPICKEGGKKKMW